jgi:PAS domain S-box-containing protein
MLRAPPIRSVTALDRFHDEVTVLCATDDDSLVDLFDDASATRDDLRIARERTPTAALDRLDDVDCLVVDARGCRGHGVELFDAARCREPSLPVVLLSDGVQADAAAVAEAPLWTDVVPKHVVAREPGLFVHRAELVVRTRKVAELARRGLAALEAVPDGVATTAPDGRLTSADELFADRFGYDRDALVGRPWRTVFTDEAAERIESEALSSLDDSWGWCGTCTGRRRSGEPIETRLTVAALDDDALVFVVPGGNAASYGD